MAPASVGTQCPCAGDALPDDSCQALSPLVVATAPTTGALSHTRATVRNVAPAAARSAGAGDSAGAGASSVPADAASRAHSAADCVSSGGSDACDGGSHDGGDGADKSGFHRGHGQHRSVGGGRGCNDGDTEAPHPEAQPGSYGSIGRDERTADSSDDCGVPTPIATRGGGAPSSSPTPRLALMTMCHVAGRRRTRHSGGAEPSAATRTVSLTCGWLPGDIVLHILLCLPAEALVAACQCCAWLRDMCERNAQLLWCGLLSRRLQLIDRRPTSTGAASTHSSSRSYCARHDAQAGDGLQLGRLPQTASRMRAGASIHKAEAGSSLGASSGGEGGTVGASAAAAVNFRLLYRQLCAPLEVRGWADARMVEPAEMSAWWRCRAIAYDVAADLVLVRYFGYGPKDDEWRCRGTLRSHVSRIDPIWYYCRRRVGDVLEVAWAPKGHPVAFWEATVRQVSESGGLLVHFTGFSNTWDEWLSPRSRRLRPHGTAR